MTQPRARRSVEPSTLFVVQASLHDAPTTKLVPFTIIPRLGDLVKQLCLAFPGADARALKLYVIWNTKDEHSVVPVTTDQDVRKAFQQSTGSTNVKFVLKPQGQSVNGNSAVENWQEEYDWLLSKYRATLAAFEELHKRNRKLASRMKKLDTSGGGVGSGGVLVPPEKATLSKTLSMQAIVKSKITPSSSLVASSPTNPLVPPAPPSLPTVTLSEASDGARRLKEPRVKQGGHRRQSSADSANRVDKSITTVIKEKDRETRRRNSSIDALLLDSVRLPKTPLDLPENPAGSETRKTRERVSAYPITRGSPRTKIQRTPASIIPKQPRTAIVGATREKQKTTVLLAPTQVPATVLSPRPLVHKRVLSDTSADESPTDEVDVNSNTSGWAAAAKPKQTKGGELLAGERKRWPSLLRTLSSDNVWETAVPERSLGRSITTVDSTPTKVPVPRTFKLDTLALMPGILFKFRAYLVHEGASLEDLLLITADFHNVRYRFFHTKPEFDSETAHIFTKWFDKKITAEYIKFFKSSTVRRLRTQYQQSELTSDSLDGILNEGQVLLQRHYDKFVLTSSHYTARELADDTQFPSMLPSRAPAGDHVPSKFDSSLLQTHKQLIRVFHDYCKRSLCEEALQYYVVVYNFKLRIFLEEEDFHKAVRTICSDWLGMGTTEPKVEFDRHQAQKLKIQAIIDEKNCSKETFDTTFDSIETSLEERFLGFLNHFQVKSLAPANMEKIRKKVLALHT